MTTTRSPDLSELLEHARIAASADVRVACIARIVRWDSTKPREVDVQPVHKRAYLDEDGDRVAEKQPVIPSVPLIYPGGNGLVITFPVAVGDEVLLVFSDDSLDKYLQTGGSSDIDPEDDRRHSITDAIAIAGVSKLSATTSVATTAIQIGTDGGAFQGVAVGGTDYDRYMSALQTHTHATPAGTATASPDLAALVVPPTSTTVKVTS